MIGGQANCNECGKRCRRGHNLKIPKWSDVKSIAINVEWIAGKRTVLRLENDGIASRLQSMWKEMQDNAQFQNQKMKEWQVYCNECENRCKKTHNMKIQKCNKCGMNCRTTQILRLEKDRIASRLQSIWKEMQDNAQFQNQKMIEWQVDCNECGIRCKNTHNLKSSRLQ